MMFGVNLMWKWSSGRPVRCFTIRGRRLPKSIMKNANSAWLMPRECLLQWATLVQLKISLLFSVTSHFHSTGTFPRLPSIGHLSAERRVTEDTRRVQNFPSGGGRGPQAPRPWEGWVADSLWDLSILDIATRTIWKWQFPPKFFVTVLKYRSTFKVWVVTLSGKFSWTDQNVLVNCSVGV